MSFARRPKYKVEDILNDTIPEPLPPLPHHQHGLRSFPDDPSAESSAVKVGENAHLIPEAPMLKTAYSALIIDTNFILSHLDLIEDLRGLAEAYNHIIVIPWVVVEELDSLKSQNRKELGSTSSVGYLARKATDWIYKKLAACDSRVVGQKINQRLDSSLHGDDSILDCCLFFQQEYLLLTVIVSNDRNLCNKSLMHNIKTVTYRRGLTAKEISETVAREVINWQEQVNEVHEKFEKRKMKEFFADKDATADLQKYFEDMSDDENEPKQTEIQEDIEMDVDEPIKPVESSVAKPSGLLKSRYNHQPLPSPSKVVSSSQKPAGPVPFPADIDTHNPVVRQQLTLLHENISRFVVAHDADGLRDFYVQKIIDEVSPIMCKLILERFPNPADLRYMTGTQTLEKLFTTKSASTFHKDEFVYDSSVVYKFRSIDTMILMVSDFYSTVFRGRIPCENQGSDHIDKYKYMEPGFLRDSPSEHKKKLFVKDMKMFIFHWTELWGGLEVSELQKHQVTSPQDLSRMQGLMQDVEQYILGTRKLMVSGLEKVMQ